MNIEPIEASEVTTQKGKTVYPDPFAALVKGRTKRKIGDIFGLTNFGVNLTDLDPGAASSIFHYHTKQDEFIYILEGNPTVIFGEKEFQMEPGQCIGFKAGSGIGHQLVNRSNEIVIYLEIGDRTPDTPDDNGGYPKDDINVHLSEHGDYVFTHKDGTPY